MEQGGLWSARHYQKQNIAGCIGNGETCSGDSCPVRAMVSVTSVAGSSISEKYLGRWRLSDVGKAFFLVEFSRFFKGGPGYRPISARSVGEQPIL